MIKSDPYPLILQSFSLSWKDAASRDELSKLAIILPNNLYRIFERVYLIGNGFRAGFYDMESKIRLWDISEILEYNNPSGYCAFGDYFFGADFVTVSLHAENFPVFLAESNVEICGQLELLFSAI